MSESYSLVKAVTVSLVNKALYLDVEEKGMLYWEKDNTFPKSFRNGVCRWRTVWLSTNRELPNNLFLALGAWDEYAFPNIHRLLIIACTLTITSAHISTRLLLPLALLSPLLLHSPVRLPGSKTVLLSPTHLHSLTTGNPCLHCHHHSPLLSHTFYIKFKDIQVKTGPYLGFFVWFLRHEMPKAWMP